MTAKPIIFYGAGYNAAQNIKRWEESGLLPVCFIDRDISKQNTHFLDKYEVLSLEAAISRYPGYDLYITLTLPAASWVADDLTRAGILPEKIKYPDGRCYRRGCNIDNFSFQPSMSGRYSVHVCCGPEDLQAPFRYEADTVKEGIERFYEARKQITDMQRQEHNPCENCAYYKYGFYHDTPPNLTVSLCSGFRGDKCNFNCIYCREIKRERMNNYHTVVDAIEELTDIFGDTEISVTVGNLEPALCEFRQEEFQRLLQNPWRLFVITNASFVIDELLIAAQAGKDIGVLSSLDAGSVETFHKIRRSGCYENIIKNLKIYSEAGVAVGLKYILVKDVNDNLTDIEGFFDAVDEIKPKRVDVSRMNQFIDYPLSENERNMMSIFFERANSRNIPVIITYQQYCPDDRQFLIQIEDRYRRTDNRGALYAE